MSPEQIFQFQLAFGYLVAALAVVTWAWPRLKAAEPVTAHRAIATFHSFRFFGLAFLVPGFVGPELPHAFAAPAAYGDLAAAVLATAALLSYRVRPLFWVLVVLFNVVGLADLALDTLHAVELKLPLVGGQLGAAYAIPFLYVPSLVATHVAAFALLLRQVGAARSIRTPEARTA